MHAAELKVASITEDHHHHGPGPNSFLNQSKSVSSNVANSNESLAPIPPLITNPPAAPGGEDALEQAAKSLQKLYVTPDLAMGGTQPQTPLLSQYHTPLHSTSAANAGALGGQSGTFFQPASPIPTGQTAFQSAVAPGQADSSVLPFPLAGSASAANVPSPGSLFFMFVLKRFIIIPPFG
jgi:hypothetical protein